MPVDGPNAIDQKPETLIELAGAGAISQIEALLATSTSPIKLVLCDDRRRLELVSTPSDKLRFWRRDALRSLPLEAS